VCPQGGWTGSSPICSAHTEGLFEGREEVFKRILEERGLKWKHEEFLGWTHIFIYRPGHKFTGWKNPGYKK